MNKIVDLHAYRIKKHVERQKKERARCRLNVDVFASQTPKRVDFGDINWTECPF